MKTPKNAKRHFPKISDISMPKTSRFGVSATIWSHQGYGEGYMRYAYTAVNKVKKVVSAKSLQARSYDVSFDSYDVIRRRGVFYGA